MKTSEASFFVLVATAVASSCTSGGGREDLLTVLARDRSAHLAADASLLAESLADTVWNIDEGRIRPVSRAELRRAFEGYFEGAVYRAWDDLAPPVIRISRDGSLAWVARRVIVDREAPGFGGRIEREHFESAWTATYSHASGRWRMTSAASTFVELPSAAQILAGARRALVPSGGRTLPGYVRFHAEAHGPGGSFEVSLAAGSDGSARIDFHPGLSMGITQESGWMVPTAGSPPVALSDTLETFLRGHDLIMNVVYPESRYGSLRFAGVESFAGAPALRVDGRDALGGPIQLYYATVDSVPLGYRVIDHVRGAGPVRTVLSAWSDQNGIRWPEAARFEQGAEVFEYRITAVETAELGDDTVFAAPG